jgi:hypothetical protein
MATVATRAADSAPTVAGRLLALAGDSDPALVQAKLRRFRQLLLVYAATRSWLWLALAGTRAPAGGEAIAVWLTLCCAAAFVTRFEAWAPRLALPALLVHYVALFPLADNHFHLEILAMALLCVADRSRAGDDALALQGLQWLTALVLLHAGLQKALHGHYLHGDFLAYMVGVQDRFALLFEWLLPASEVARLQGYDPLREGAGPYRVDSLAFVAVSNLVVAAELILPGLLLWRRTRGVAWVGALALVLGIQLGAREIGFALLFSSLLLLFPSRDVLRRVLPFVIALCAWALAAAFGIAPGRGLLDPGML